MEDGEGRKTGHTVDDALRGFLVLALAATALGSEAEASAVLSFFGAAFLVVVLLAVEDLAGLEEEAFSVLSALSVFSDFLAVGFFAVVDLLVVVLPAFWDG